MIFSYTGLAYLLGFFAVGLLSYRFFQYWQKEKTVVSKLFFYFTSILSLFMLVAAVTGLFFADNTAALRITVILSTFIQGWSFAVLGYLIFYLKFSKVSPWIGFSFLLSLGMVATYFVIKIPFTPYLESNGGINWDIQPLVDTIRSCVFALAFIPVILIILQQLRETNDPAVKAKAWGIGLALTFGVVVGLFDFLLEKILKLGALSSDVAMAVVSVVIFVTVFFTQKPPKKEKEEPVFPSDKISW